jgi:hypothetical protein
MHEPDRHAEFVVGDTPSVASPSLRITSQVIEEAIEDAEHLLESRGDVNSLDRFHTTLDSYLVVPCDDAGLAYGADPGVTDVFELSKQQPALQATGPRGRHRQDPQGLQPRARGDEPVAQPGRLGPPHHGATNSQSPIELRNLRSNEPEQERLTEDLELLGYEYEPKRHGHHPVHGRGRGDPGHLAAAATPDRGNRNFRSLCLR